MVKILCDGGVAMVEVRLWFQLSGKLEILKCLPRKDFGGHKHIT